MSLEEFVRVYDCLRRSPLYIAQAVEARRPEEEAAEAADEEAAAGEDAALDALRSRKRIEAAAFGALEVSGEEAEKQAAAVEGAAGRKKAPTAHLSVEV